MARLQGRSLVRTLIVNSDTTSSSPTALCYLEMIHGGPSFGHKPRGCLSERLEAKGDRDALKTGQLWPIIIISKETAQEW